LAKKCAALEKEVARIDLKAQNSKS
jgi:hypothetical protein